MKMLLKIFVGGFLMLGSMGMAFAGPMNPDFTKADVNNPNERLEFRTGKPGAQDWEIGLGKNTQGPGQFNQANVLDPNWWELNTAYSFNYSINQNNEAEFAMPDLGIYLSYANMDLGNTLEVYAKRGVEVSFGGENLVGNPNDPFGVDYGYISIDPVTGFSLDGTIMFTELSGSGSMEGVTITAGNLPASAPVPEPGTVFLLGGGIVGLVVYRRRSRK
ncbi:MAG: PEP-CTERM sorting domain-containing protein [Desulfococcaceae bacterium]